MSQPASKPAPPVAATKAESILRARGVSRAFHMGDSTIHILKGCDLTLRRGEFVAIEGRSGSGKSTLLHILGALDSPDAGTLEFEGEDYTRPAVPPGMRGWRGFVRSSGILVVAGGIVLAALLAIVGFRKTFPGMEITHTILALVAYAMIGAWWLLRRHPLEAQAARLRNRDFGFVFQFYHLLPELNVLENTLVTAMVDVPVWRYLSRRAELTARATAVLTELGMAHRLGHRPSQLSGGERQRVAIARALMNSPKVLFADEPTGNLDTETGRQIMNLLERLHRDKGQTIVMVTHDRALAREADRVLVLRDGKLQAAE